MDATLELTTSDLRDLETNSMWLSTQENNDEFAFLLDENCLENITNTPIPTSQFLQHTHSDSSEDEVVFQSYQPSPPSSPSEHHVGSPSSSCSEFSDTLSPLLFSADIPTFSIDPAAFQELSATLQLPFPFPVSNSQDGSQMATDSVEEEEEEDTKRSVKKRRRGQPSKISKKDFVEVSEEKLLEFDSKQMEEYICDITAHKSLSHAQLKGLKRIRRLIKNREYAQSSRNKKKQYVEEVEKKLNKAHEENSALQQKLNALEMENNTLKQQLTMIGTAIKKDPEIMEKIKRLSTGAAPVKTTNKTSISTKKATTAFSATLFVILFSFGLFVNFGKPADPFSCSNGGAINKFTTQSSYHTGRVLLEVSSSMTEDQPTLFDLYAPASLHNFASYWFPRPVLEESSSLEPDSGFRMEEFSAKRSFGATVFPSVKESIVEPTSSSPSVPASLSTPFQQNYTEILVSVDRSEL